MTARRSNPETPSKVQDALDGVRRAWSSSPLAGRGRLVAFALVFVVVLVFILLRVLGGDDGSAGSQPNGPAVTQPATETGKPDVAVTKRPDVPVGSSADLQQNVTVKVVSIQPVTLKASGIGEIAGPGAAVRLRVGNASAKPVDLGQLVVNANYGKSRTPAPPNDTEAQDQLSGKLKAGKSATGTYYFKVPRAQLNNLRVEVSSGTSPYVITFVR